MKKNLIPKIFLLLYLLTFFTSIEFKSPVKYQILEILQNKEAEFDKIAKKFDAKIFNIKEIENVSLNSKYFDRPVVLDTLILGWKKIDRIYLIQAQIINSQNKFIIAELECSETLFKKLQELKKPSAILIGKISSISFGRIKCNVESLFERKKLYLFKDKILIKGKCLDLVA